jgi:hypothetical protein
LEWSLQNEKEVRTGTTAEIQLEVRRDLDAIYGTYIICRYGSKNGCFSGTDILRILPL